MPTVEWRPVPSYPKYEASTDGYIRHAPRKRLLNPNPDANGYKMVSLANEQGMKRLLVHRLIAQTFLLNPGDLPVVNHMDRNRSNNVVSNLEWATQKSNVIHASSGKKPRSPAVYADETVLSTRRVSVGDLPGYEGKFANYFVTETGLVLCQKTDDRFRVLCSSHNGDGYQTVYLSYPGIQQPAKIHRLVALAFCQFHSETRTWVNHLDHDRGNNHWSNLEWSTPKGNRNHGSHVVLASEAIQQDLRDGKTHQQIASDHGVCTGTVSRLAEVHNLQRDQALPEELRQAILADLRAEMTSTAVAKKYKVGTTTIHLLAKEHGVKPRGRRLLSTTRAAIEVLLRGGVSQTRAAKVHGVDRGTVALIARELQALA